MTTRFSIIIPTYNRASFVCTAVNSVLKQHYDNFEIIIIDDGSSDNTEEVIQEAFYQIPLVKYVKQKNAERGAARNLGVSLSEGDYINFLDSDDFLLPNHLSVAERYIKEARPEVFHLNYRIEDPAGHVIAEGPSGKITANGDLIHGNFLSCNGVIIRRDVAISNSFIEDRMLAAMEDWELWLRLSIQYNIHMVDEVTSVIINHEDRSVLVSDNHKLIQRVDFLLGAVLGNPGILKYFKKNISSFKASCYSYVALHIAMTGKDKSDVIKFTLKAVKEDLSTLFTRRFLAIIKHFIR